MVGRHMVSCTAAERVIVPCTVQGCIDCWAGVKWGVDISWTYSQCFVLTAALCVHRAHASSDVSCSSVPTSDGTDEPHGSCLVITESCTLRCAGGHG
jgi:hypothetical protein